MSDVVRYRVRHETVYHYGGDVAHSHQLLHLTPHDRLEVLAEVGVEVRKARVISVAESEPWEMVRESLSFSAQPLADERLDACRYRMESCYVKLKQTFTDYADDCFTPRRPALAAAEALMHKMYREFSYAPGTTTIRTSAMEAFKARQGVCQDFAHIMIACLRSRRLAARYVNGYLRTLPPPGAEAAYLGADASHAWVSVFCPPFGWVSLDPTNDLRVSSDHIVIAWGRDFGDVSPLRGVIVGGGNHRLSVRVSVQAE